jgi:HTH-type transcriptional regulator / antitoxin MqsA
MNPQPDLCPICGQGQLIEHTHGHRTDPGGQGNVVSGLLHSICNGCGEYVATPEQSRHNKRMIVAARGNAIRGQDHPSPRIP